MFPLLAIFLAHFSLVKFHSQKEKLPAAAPYYELKVGVPTFGKCQET